MTARRRRKSGSGPAATALIAWVSAQRENASAPVSVMAAGSGGWVSGGRVISIGRACGLAAGTVLACGSVLIGATHVGEGQLAGDSASLRGSTPTAPGAIGNSEGYRANTLARPQPAAPNMASAQVVTDAGLASHSRWRWTRRNDPLSWDVPANLADPANLAKPGEPPVNSGAARQPSGSATPSTGYSPIAPVSQVLDPAARGIGRVAPTGGVLAPTHPRKVRGESPRHERVSPYPAMAMLTSVLPVG